MGSAEYRIGDLNSTQLELPKYQRSLVWKRGKKEVLIDSLYRGYPVGALLLWEVPGSSPKVFQVIDGQQRVNAIREYLARPLSYLSGLAKLLPQSLLAQFVAALNESVALLPEPGARSLTEKECKVAISEWMSATEVNDVQRGFDAVTLVQSVLAAADIEESLRPTLILSQEVQQAANAVLAHIVEEKNRIENRTIPAIIYEGDAAALPEVFERVNTQLTTLKEFDKYAASWSHRITSISDSDVTRAIEEKYRAQLEAGYDIEGVDLQPGNNIHVTEYNLFEYFFGLGKKLKQRHPLLFDSGLGASEPEPVGFTLSAAVHGLGYTELSKLDRIAEQHYRAPGSALNLDSLGGALEEACTFVETLLKPRVGYKFNSRNGAAFVQGHTLYQSMSLVAAVMVLQRDPDTLTPRSDWPAAKAKLERTLVKHYLGDIVSGVWSSHGNSTLLERVWADRESKQVSSYYLTDISREQMEKALDAWFELQMQRQHRKRTLIDKDSRAFMAYVFANHINIRQLNEGDWEIAHVMPVRRLSAAIGDGSGWPINCVGNLALFTKEVNREQTSQCLPEYLASIEDQDVRAARTAEIEPLLFCDVDSTGMTDSYTLPQYQALCRTRFRSMRDSVLNSLSA